MMGVNTDDEEMSPGSTLTDGLEGTEKSCEFVQHENEKSLPQDTDCDVGIQDRKSAKGTGIPLITSLQNTPSQPTIVFFNTEHNEAQKAYTNGGEYVPSNTPTSQRPGTDGEDEKKEPSHGAPVFIDTDTSADDTYDLLVEIRERLRTDTNNDWNAMHKTLLDKISPCKAIAFTLELPSTPDKDQMDEEGYPPLYKAPLEPHFEGGKYIISREANRETVEYLMTEGADVNEKKGRIPPHKAAARDHKEVMEYLIHQGSNVDKKDKPEWITFNAAVQEGNLEAVNYLMTTGLKQSNHDGMTPLYAAALDGRLDIVKFFASNGADVNEANTKGNILLHGAAARGHLKVMEYLIQQGSDVNKRDNTGWTPFNAAVQDGHLEAVKYLMTKGAKQNNYDGMTPLYAATQFGHLDIMEFFISKGADVNEKVEEGMNARHGAAIETGDPRPCGQHNLSERGFVTVKMKDADKQSRIEKLTSKIGELENGNGCNQADIAKRGDNEHSLNNISKRIHDDEKGGNEERNPFSYAKLRFPEQDSTLDQMEDTKCPGISKRDTITNGKDCSSQHGPQTPLQAAANTGHLNAIDIEMLQHLTLQRCDVNKKDSTGKTPLTAAFRNGHLQAGECCTPAGVKKNRHDGMTPLYAAALDGRLEIVKYLVSNGADVNEANDKGNIPLHGAAARGHMKVMEYLIQQGSDVNKKDNTEWTPFNAAVQGGHLEAVKYLMTEGAKQNIYDGMSSLYAAARFGHLDIVKFFISKGADVNEKMEEGMIARHGAALETGDARSCGQHILIGGENVTVTLTDADKQSRTGKLTSQIGKFENGNDCNQADIAEIKVDEFSLISLSTRIQHDEKGGNKERNPFINANLKYPAKDTTLDQMEDIKCPGTSKRDIITNATDWFPPHGPQTWEYSELYPPYKQPTETDGHPSEEPESRYHSLIDEKSQAREPSSMMNPGNDLPINGTSKELGSISLINPPAVVHQKLYDGNPVSSLVWKAVTNRRTSVDRCPSILALVQTFLQVIISLAIILAGSPVLVAGSSNTERVTLQAGQSGMVPFHIPLSPSNTSQIVISYILRFESQPRPFCINGVANIEGFKSPAQLPRFTTSVIETRSSYCVNLLIDIVDMLDEDRYVLTAVRRGFESVRYESLKKEIHVQIPPGPAKCFITLSEHSDWPYEVHCRATSGRVKTTLSCYQNDQKINLKGDITDNGQVTKGIFLLPDNIYFSCCSHDVFLNVSQTMCNDFEWPPIKEIISQTVNTEPTSVTDNISRPVNEHPETTSTPQMESHNKSGACRLFMFPFSWQFTYLFIYTLAFVTMY